MKIAVFGANTRCLSIVAKDFNSDVQINVFFDNDIKKTHCFVKNGYYYFNNSKKYLDIPNTIIDLPQNYKNYEFDYIVIVAGRNNEIEKQLISLGVNPACIIVYDRLITSGIIKVPHLSESKVTYDMLLKAAEKKEVTVIQYEQYALDLLKVSKLIFNNKYRLIVLENTLKAMIASIKKEPIIVNNVKYHYEVFTHNPSLFVYESSDILMDIQKKELDDIEFIEGPYEYSNITIQENDIVFDIGANFGVFTAIAATKAVNGKVYAFEPIAETREILKKTTNFYHNIELAEYALSNKKGECEIDLSNYDSNQGCSSIMNIPIGARTEKVNMISLDDYVKAENISKVDFIKADIEGAERMLIEGARETLKKFAPKLAICTYHYPEDPALLEFLILSANPNYIIEKAFGKLYAYVS